MSKCQKVCYTDRKEAKKHVKEMNRSGKLERPLTNVYYCSDCLHWHVTSSPKISSRDYTRRLNKQK